MKVKKEDMAAFRETKEGQGLVLKTLALYTYFKLREKSGSVKLNSSLFHLKALVDDLINKVFGTSSTALDKDEDDKKEKNDGGKAADQWGDF